MKYLSLIFLLILNSVTQHARADTLIQTQVANNAAKCAALNSLLTILSVKHPEFGGQVTKISIMFADVMAFNSSEIKTRGDQHERVESAKQNVGWWYELNRSAVFDLYQWCDGWRIKAADHVLLNDLSTGQLSSKRVREFMRTFPQPPKASEFDGKEDERAERVIVEAFRAYEEIGGYTSDAIVEWVKEKGWTKEQSMEWFRSLGE